MLTFHRREVNILRVEVAGQGPDALGAHVELAESLGFALDVSRPGEVRLRIDKGRFEPGIEADCLPVLPIRRVSAGYDGGVAEIIFEMADPGGAATAVPSEAGRGIEITFAGFLPEEPALPALEPRPFPTRPMGGDRRRRGTPLVLVDPGHGGTERGAIGPTGFLEKKVTLEIALHLKRILAHDDSFRVMLTREDDRLVPLLRRAEMANLFGADVFVSVHCNSWPGGTADGFEVYVATRAPGADSAAGSGANAVRWELTQDVHLEESRLLAGFVREELGRLGLRDRGTRSAKFVVLRGVDAPAVLVETAFISNPDEEARLQDDLFREEVAGALADAVRRFASAPAGSARPARGG
jgi:N-acetylmuramoyl-L-alanine amidase